MYYEIDYVSSRLNIPKDRIESYSELFEKNGHQFKKREKNHEIRLFAKSDILLLEKYLGMVEKYPKSPLDYLVKYLFYIDNPLNIEERENYEKMKLNNENMLNNFLEIVGICYQQLELISELTDNIESLKNEVELLYKKIENENKYKNVKDCELII